MDQARAFKESLDHLLLSIIILLDCLEYLERTPRRIAYSNFISDLIAQNLTKDRKYFDYFSLARKVKRTKSSESISRLISRYPELGIKGIEADVMTFTPPTTPNDEIILDLKARFKKNEEYYRNQYIAFYKHPEFKVRDIFIAKGYFKDKHISRKAAREKARRIYRLAKKEKKSFRRLIKEHSDTPYTAPRIIKTLGDGYDILIGLKKGDVCPIGERDEGYFISQFISKRVIDLDFGSKDYEYHLGSSVLEEYNTETLKRVLNYYGHHGCLPKWFLQRYSHKEKIARLNANPVYSQVGERGMRGNGDPSIPFAVADRSDGSKVPYVLDSAGKIVFVDNPEISSKGVSGIARSLQNYISEADELQLSELLLWVKRCRARDAKGNVLFKSVLRRNKSGGIKASLLSTAYKQSYSAIRAMSRRVRDLRYRERLKVYYEVYLDLFFNYTYFVYEDKIKRLMSGTLTNTKRAEIGCYGKLFDRITSDLKSISDCCDKRKEKARYASKKVFSIDTHDEAYNILKGLDTSNSTIIHFDAHKDLWNLSNMVINDSRFGINSANYLSAVMRDRLCKKLMLVFPDGGENGGEGPQIRKEHFIWEQFYYFPMLLKYKNEYPMYVEGREVIATDLFNLPESIHDVILDIDFDYFICNPLAIREPWIGIDEFIDTLKEKNIDVRAVIFSYSIKDGYVCKRFKEYGNRIVRKLNTLLN